MGNEHLVPYHKEHIEYKWPVGRVRRIVSVSDSYWWAVGMFIAKMCNT